MNQLTKTQAAGLAQSLFSILTETTRPAPQPKRMKITVNVRTEEYRFNHGAEPRGQGSWAFQLEGHEEPTWFQGTFSQAKAQAVKQARAEARQAGATWVDVVVLS